MCGPRAPCRLLILLSLIGQSGSAARPAVTFSPSVNKIFRGESIEMSCEGDPTASFYSWYHNNRFLGHREMTYLIVSAVIEDSGDYQCRAMNGVRSEVVTLTVTRGPVILQAPLYVYEGDDVSLRCHTPLGDPSGQTIFYKDNQTVQESTSDLLHITNMDSDAIYRCSKILAALSVYRDDTEVLYTDPSWRALVTFTPNWNKILTGENITMTCRGEVPPVDCRWLQNGTVVAVGRSYTITSARVTHSGNYQLWIDHQDYTRFRLEVADGPVILQAPLLVSRTGELRLRCHSRPGYSAHRTTFYKDNRVLSSGRNDLFIIPRDNPIGGRYSCEKEFILNEYKEYTDEVYLHTRELFPKPNILTSPDPVVEDDHMTLTCHTSLGPLRKKTELQYAFYKDGRSIREFLSSNKYEFRPTWPIDSGNYSCEVRTPTNRVRKESREITVHVQETEHRDTSTTIIALVMVFLLLLTALLSILVVTKNIFKPTTNVHAKLYQDPTSNYRPS